jgi:hypothetical protein
MLYHWKFTWKHALDKNEYLAAIFMVEQFFTEKNKSFIKILNKIGASIEP